MFPNNQREQFENRVIFNKWNLKDFVDVSRQPPKKKKEKKPIVAAEAEEEKKNEDEVIPQQI